MARSIDELIARANAGRTAAMIELGHSYMNGLDPEGNEFPKDLVQARRWLEKAHARGATTASLLLGTMYERGIGVPLDMAKAIEFYVFASQRGGYFAHLFLGRIYSRREGEHALAAKWYRKVLEFPPSDVDAEDLEEARTYVDAVEGGNSLND